MKRTQAALVRVSPSAARFGRWIYLLALAVAALALGAVHVPVLIVIAALISLSTFLLLWSAEPFPSRRAASLLFVTAVALTAFTALQSVPLPAGLVARISPRAADVWARALVALKESGPSWHPLSLDPIATRIEFLRGVVYLHAFVGGVFITRTRDGMRFLVRGVAVIGVGVAIAALLHPALGARTVFGFYRPEAGVSERHLGPLLNPNSLAAYVNIAASFALAGALSVRGPLPRPVSAAAFILLTAVQIWVGSRGGLLCLGLATAVVFALRRKASARATASTSSLVAGVVSAGALAMTALAGSKDAFDELADLDVSKLAIQAQFLPVVRDNFLVGLGRGAFESSFPAYRTGHGYVVFSHPEQVIIQWAAEWGLLVSLPALLVIAYALRPSIVEARGHLAIGAWAALAAAFVHNLVDLNSEIPGLMVAYCACAALIVSGSGNQPDRFDRWAARPRRLAAAMTILTALGVALGTACLGRDLYTDRFALRDLALSGHGSEEEFERLARAAILRHPAEPFLPYACALRAWRAHRREVFAWSAQALERSSVFAPAHILLARALRESAPSQARLEYRIAMEQAPEFVGRIVGEASRLVGSFDDALELVPERSAAAVIAEMSPAIGARLPATQALLDEELLRRAPDDRSARVRRAEALVLQFEHARELGDPGSLQMLAVDETKRLVERFPASVRARSLVARLQAAAGDARGAAAMLAESCTKLDDPAACTIEELRIAEAAGLDVTGTVDRLVRLPCGSEAICLRNLGAAGAAEERRNRPERALAFYAKAFERYPEHDASAERLGALAQRLGLYGQAFESYQRLAKRHPEEPRYAQEAARMRTLARLPPRP